MTAEAFLNASHTIMINSAMGLVAFIFDLLYDGVFYYLQKFINLFLKRQSKSYDWGCRYIGFSYVRRVVQRMATQEDQTNFYLDAGNECKCGRSAWFRLLLDLILALVPAVLSAL